MTFTVNEYNGTKEICEVCRDMEGKWTDNNECQMYSLSDPKDPYNTRFVCEEHIDYMQNVREA